MKFQEKVTQENLCFFREVKSVLVALESHFEVNFKRAPKVNTTDMISCHVSYSRFTERATMNGSAKTVLLMYRDMN